MTKVSICYSKAIPILPLNTMNNHRKQAAIYHSIKNRIISEDLLKLVKLKRCRNYYRLLCNNKKMQPNKLKAIKVWGHQWLKNQPILSKILNYYAKLMIQLLQMKNYKKYQSNLSKYQLKRQAKARFSQKLKVVLRKRK